MVLGFLYRDFEKIILEVGSFRVDRVYVVCFSFVFLFFFLVSIETALIRPGPLLGACIVNRVVRNVFSNETCSSFRLIGFRFCLLDNIDEGK